MRILALDIGTRRTGCAFYDDANGVPLPLDTLLHVSQEEFADAVHLLVKNRKIDEIVVGLPLLLSGKSGAQTASVKKYVSALTDLTIPLTLQDERYTTPKIQAGDRDALAALTLLTTYVERKNS